MNSRLWCASRWPPGPSGGLDEPAPGFVYEAHLTVKQGGDEFLSVHAVSGTAREGQWLIASGDMLPSAARAALLAGVAEWLDSLGGRWKPSEPATHPHALGTEAMALPRLEALATARALSKRKARARLAQHLHQVRA